MASTVGHVRQSLTFDVIKVLFYGHAFDSVFIDLIEVRDELPACHDHGFSEDSHLLLA